MKTKNLCFATLLFIIFTYIMTMIMPIQANAVFDKNFDVTWENSSHSATVNATNSTDSAFTTIIDKYKVVITFVSAIGAVTMVAIFIINFMKLGTTSGNPTERSKCITALIWSGLAAAGLGSVALIVGVFYGMLKGDTKAK